MAGKTGEAALQEKLEQIKLDYLGLIEKIKTENVRAASDLEKKLLKDDEDFKARQERERREFEVRMEIEKEEFKEKQKREREIADGEASERLKQAETFIDNVKSPVVKDKHRLGQMDIGSVSYQSALSILTCFNFQQRAGVSSLLPGDASACPHLAVCPGNPVTRDM